MSALDIAASPPIRRDETVQISLLLSFACGYLDAFTDLALSPPVMALLTVLLRCEIRPNEEPP